MMIKIRINELLPVNYQNARTASHQDDGQYVPESSRSRRTWEQLPEERIPWFGSHSLGCSGCYLVFTAYIWCTNEDEEEDDDDILLRNTTWISFCLACGLCIHIHRTGQYLHHGTDTRATFAHNAVFKITLVESITNMTDKASLHIMMMM